MQRQLALRKFASELALKRRSRNLARDIMRTRLAGQKGSSYDKLTPSEKIMVDKVIQGREKTITAISKRVSQKVRTKEAQRLTRVRANLPVKREKKKMISAEVERKDINKIFEEVTAKRKNKTALIYTAGKADPTPGKITAYKEKHWRSIQSEDNCLFDAIFNVLTEDSQVKAHLRAATLSQQRGQYRRASIHRKIASALQRKDLTSARALLNQLRTVND